MAKVTEQHMTASQLSQQYQSVLKPTNKPEHEISQVTSTDDKYEVRLSIHEFEPHELSVKVVDRYVHVEGRHEEKNDKIGFFTRKFTRSYFLPEGAQPETVRCTFNIDTSVLTVTAPIVVKKPSKEYIIPVIIVGKQPTPGGSTTSKDTGGGATGGIGAAMKTPSKKSKVPKQVSLEAVAVEKPTPRLQRSSSSKNEKEPSPPHPHHSGDVRQDQAQHHHHHQHQSRSEHHIHQHQVRQQSRECPHEPPQPQPRSSSTSTSAPTTGTRPHRPKQQYPDHQEIDRLLYQQLLEQQQRQRQHQQHQQQLFQQHQQQYQHHYQHQSK